MQESEEEVKQILIEKGYKVRREGSDGMPDFKCVSKNECFFVEVKTKNDGLRLNQLKCISKLLEEGNKVYLCYYKKDEELELFEITTILKIKKTFNKNLKFPTINKEFMTNCPVPNCQKIVVGITKENRDYNINTHIKFKHPDYKQKESEKQ